MPETFILIPGRTSDQGCGISEGKFLEKYQREINSLQVAPGDMTRLGLQFWNPSADGTGKFNAIACWDIASAPPRRFLEVPILALGI